jgi:hypothetical protein
MCSNVDLPSLSAALDAYARYHRALARAQRRPRTAEIVGEYLDAAVAWIAATRGLTATEREAVAEVGRQRLAVSCDRCAVPLGADDCCPRCGVYHGEPCPECGRRGYHACDDGAERRDARDL